MRVFSSITTSQCCSMADWSAIYWSVAMVTALVLPWVKATSLALLKRSICVPSLDSRLTWPVSDIQQKRLLVDFSTTHLELRNLSHYDTLVTSNSITSIPVSYLNFCRPFRTPSLKDLSNLPLMSYTTAGLKSEAPAAPNDSAGTTNENNLERFISVSCLFAFWILNRFGFQYFRHHVLRPISLSRSCR